MARRSGSILLHPGRMGKVGNNIGGKTTPFCGRFDRVERDYAFRSRRECVRSGNGVKARIKDRERWSVIWVALAVVCLKWKENVDATTRGILWRASILVLAIQFDLSSIRSRNTNILRCRKNFFFSPSFNVDIIIITLLLGTTINKNNNKISP